MSFFKRLRPTETVGSRLYIALLLGVLCAVFGPFNTYAEFTLLQRLLIWMPIALLALIIACASLALVQGVSPNRSTIYHMVMAGVGFSFVFSIAIWWFGGRDWFTAQSREMSFVDLKIVVAKFVIICILIWMVIRIRYQQDETPRLYDRLPHLYGAEIVRLKVDDHYVEVHLSDMSVHRILLRFSDAVQEMAPVQGFTTHRSHWVAKSHVKGAITRGKKEFVVMSTGDEIPVTKTFRDQLIDAGVFPQARPLREVRS